MFICEVCKSDYLSGKMDDIFRSFFGFPNSRRGRRPDEDDDEGRGAGFPFGGAPPPDWHEHDEGDNDEMNDMFHFHFREADDMFRHFEEMFKSMGMIEFPPIRPNLPHIETPDTESSLRDRMLKEPDSRVPSADGHPDSRGSSSTFSVPGSVFGDIGRTPKWAFRQEDDKKDLDLDEEIRQKGIGSILPPSSTDPAPKSRGLRIRSQIRNESVRIIRGADGKVEEHRTVIDGKGNKETTVTRRIGDQTYSVTTREDGQGGQEKSENFINMDQNDLSEFDRRWTHPAGRRSNPLDPRDEFVLPHQDPQTESIFKRLFGFNLPGSGRT